MASLTLLPFPKKNRQATTLLWSIPFRLRLALEILLTLFTGFWVAGVGHCLGPAPHIYSLLDKYCTLAQYHWTMSSPLSPGFTSCSFSNTYHPWQRLEQSSPEMLLSQYYHYIEVYERTSQRHGCYSSSVSSFFSLGSLKILSEGVVPTSF